MAKDAKDLEVRLLMLGAVLADSEPAAQILADAWDEIQRLRAEVARLTEGAGR